MIRLMKAVICHVGVLLCVLGHAGLICESEAQSIPRDSPSGNLRELQSSRLGKLVPYEGYEERLRQSPQWQTMTSDEQAEAIDKIVLARKQFLERQQQLHARYEKKIKKNRMLKEIIAGRWKNRGNDQDQERDLLWSRFQNLPAKKRRNLERQLGLRNTHASQLQQKFHESMAGLSYAKRDHILRELQ